jgi:hypothetical protein
VQSELKGLIAGFIATLVLSAALVINDTMNLMPQIDIVRMLMSSAQLSRTSAWMDHFIVGVVVWGLLFAAYDGLAPDTADWLKGIIFGAFAWLLMMVTFLPLAGAGFFGVKIGAGAVVGLLMLHLLYGLVLGATYGGLGTLAAARTPDISSEQQAVADAESLSWRNRDTSVSFNDDLPSSSPSGKTVLIICGSLLGFAVVIVLAMEFRGVFGL